VSDVFPQGPVVTGDAAVDAALTRLADLEPTGTPEDHLPVLGEVLEALRGRLGAAEA
jgi:hypothetical protein